MKLVLTFVCLILAAQSTILNRTLWDNWHNNSTTFSHPWTSNSSSTYTPATITGWSRNAVNNISYFSDFTFRENQYLHYQTSDQSVLIFCGPKSYLVGNTSLCQRDPFYWNTSDSVIKTHCVPNSYGFNSILNAYGEGCATNSQYPCCYLAS